MSTTASQANSTAAAAAAAAGSEVYNNQVLSRDVVQRFDKDGFLVLEDLLSEKEKQEMFKWTDDIQAWPETKGSLFSLLSLSLSPHLH